MFGTNLNGLLSTWPLINGKKLDTARVPKTHTLKAFVQNKFVISFQVCRVGEFCLNIMSSS